MGTFRRKEKKVFFSMGKIFIRRQSLKFLIFFQKKKNFDFQNFLFFAIAQGVER